MLSSQRIKNDRMVQLMSLAFLTVFAQALLVRAAEVNPAVAHPQVIEIEGWTLRIHPDLLDSKSKAGTEQAIELLTLQLKEINRVVPGAAVAELHKVPLWFSPPYEGVPPRAEYHPDAGWLRDNHRDPAMAQAVEFTDIHDFQRETRRMPVFVLHELAHAYHDRVLPRGFENPEIQAAYDQAKASGIYDRVEQRFGDGRSALVRAYAMTNPMEYFAESSEAFFGTNDFFPFNRNDLTKSDPEMVKLLTKLWGETASQE